MAEIEIVGRSPKVAAENMAAFEDFAERYRGEASFRAAVDENAAGAMRQIGMGIPPGMSVRVVADSDDVRHIVFPSDPNTDIGDEVLELAVGGDTASTAGTASTLACSTIAVSSIATLGTIGC